jgi:hypothetical protein
MPGNGDDHRRGDDVVEFEVRVGGDKPDRR